MKKVLLSCVIVLLLCLSVFSAEQTLTPVSLCCKGEVYSVDYVFSVDNGQSITGVAINVEGCYYDWNYVEDVERLYISIASASEIKNTEILLNVVSETSIVLEPVLVSVNGKNTSGISSVHTFVVDPYVAPTVGKDGHTEGKVCSSCGLVAKKSETIPATGPWVSAVLSDDGTLCVTGALSDVALATENVYFAAYSGKGKMKVFKDITEYNQTNFKFDLSGCNDIDTVKIIKLESDSLTPVCEALEINVTNEN